jgi:hypothetical protein
MLERRQALKVATQNGGVLPVFVLVVVVFVLVVVVVVLVEPALNDQTAKLAQVTQPRPHRVQPEKAHF